MYNELDNQGFNDESRRHLVRERAARALHRRVHPARKRRSELENSTAHTIHNYPRKGLRGVLAAILAVLLFVGVSAGLLLNDLRNRVADAGVDVEQFIPQEEEPRPPVDSYDGRPVNILILGTDSRVGAGNSRYGAEEGDESMRADVTILAHISEDRTRVQLVSIPRDTIVEIPECVLKDGSTTYPQTGQINWAMSIGSEYTAENLDAGIGCTWRTVEELTGVTIDEFVLFDFAGFEGIVNALGGVEMCFEEDLYDEAAELDVAAGCQTLNGHDALAYARARKEVGNGSDISRIGRQQELMGRIFHTAMSQNLLTDFPKMYSFVSESLATIKTSSNLARVNTSMGLAYSLSALPSEGLQFITMPLAEAPWDPYRVIPTWQADLLWESLRTDSDLPPDIWITDSEGNLILVEEPTEPVEYMTDEEGNVLYDEFGEPIPVEEPVQ
ncbi:MAG: LCP family protein [Actinomycetaceae bacterium]|nr:LCP family protein [Actinomycetaceae bacterium]